MNENLNQHFRGTGRTTRMLQAARQAVFDGDRVCIVAANVQHLKLLQRQMRMMGLTEVHLKSIEWTHMSHCDFSQGRVCSRLGSRRKVYVDHFAIESFFAPLFQQMHAWDAKSESSPRP